MQTQCALVASGHYCGDGDADYAAETAAVRATAGEWMLLAPVGTDEGARMMWKDSGPALCRDHRQDLIARRFEATRFILQCY